MDTALEAQPQDSWDSFPLFQLLNNFLRNDSKHVRFLSYMKWGGEGRWRECCVSECVFIELSYSLNKIDIDNINVFSVSLTFSSWVLGETSNMPRFLHWPLKFLLFLPFCFYQELIIIGIFAVPCESENLQRLAFLKHLRILASLKDNLEMCHYSKNHAMLRLLLICILTVLFAWEGFTSVMMV